MQIILSEEDKELNQMLEEAHKMLTDMGMKIAPISSIMIRYNMNRRQKAVAACSPYCGAFLITLHYKAKDEPEVRKKQTYTFRSILHELVHTCYDEETHQYGLPDHNEKFLRYAHEIESCYGINIIQTIMPADLKYTDRDCIERCACENCGAATEFYSEKTRKAYMERVRGTRGHCNYCGAAISFD